MEEIIIKKKDVVNNTMSSAGSQAGCRLADGAGVLLHQGQWSSPLCAISGFFMCHGLGLDGTGRHLDQNY